ncbi:MAG: hypothetical protein R2705_03895 [Ilumatobacteraceae bacterium]
MAIGPASSNGMPQDTLNSQRDDAPEGDEFAVGEVVSPVVPKISESPTEVMAMTSPRRVPSTSRCGTWSTQLVLRVRDSPVTRFLVALPVTPAVAVRAGPSSPVAGSGNNSSPSGSVDSSTTRTNSRPASPSAVPTPLSSVTTEATSVPSGVCTLTVTPGSGVLVPSAS